MVQAVQTAVSAAERLGPAERIIQSILDLADAHLHHGRPGMLVEDPRVPTGVTWTPVSWKVDEGGVKRVYALPPPGTKKKGQRPRIQKGAPPARPPIGVLEADGAIRSDTGRVIGRYQPPGLVAEVATWMYRQVADVWSMDNEFAARWASWAWAQEHKDIKVVLCAFMLVQSRFGKPVTENGKMLFRDANFREVGRAMIALPRKDGRHLDAKLIFRAHQLLGIPGVAAINRELGFGRSARNPTIGAWPLAATSWLRMRERNPKLLAGLLKSGYGGMVKIIARAAHYKPDSPQFFKSLRWQQTQRAGGHFTIGLDLEVDKASSWTGMTETQICEAIEREKLSWKVIAGRLPDPPGMTRAIVACAIEHNAFSDRDLLVFTPTLEELGLLSVQTVRERWDHARLRADDMRAANIARNVQTKEVKDALQEAADTAMQKQVAEAVRDLRVFVFVDISGSMERSIDAAKRYLARLLQAFPLERLHVAIFNSVGREVAIRHASAAGVESAFAGVRASGGTNYGEGLHALAHHKYIGKNVGPSAIEDNLFLFVGDEGAPRFTPYVEMMGIKPMAFGLLKLPGEDMNCVQITARELGIPCFMIDERIFADPYAIPRTLRTIIASTPVQAQWSAASSRPRRETLVEQILKTDLLQLPVGV